MKARLHFRNNFGRGVQLPHVYFNSPAVNVIAHVSLIEQLFFFRIVQRSVFTGELIAKYFQRFFLLISVFDVRRFYGR